MSMLRGALTDSDGQWDIAYISLFYLMLAVVGPIVVMTVMSVVGHLRCVPHEIIAKASEQVTVIACVYDPQPLGNAIGFACGGFGVALGALAAYMAATRRTATSTTTKAQSGEQAATVTKTETTDAT